VLLPLRPWEGLILITDGSSPGASFGAALSEMVRPPAGTRNPPEGPVSLMQKDGPLNRIVELAEGLGLPSYAEVAELLLGHGR
jgi:hypothetical protein